MSNDIVKRSGTDALPSSQDARFSDARKRRMSAEATPTGLGADASRDIAGALNAILADTFALYM